MATRVDYKKLDRERKAALATAGGDPLKASLAHHLARMERAVAAKDYSTMRDAQQVMAELRARIRD